MKNYAKIKKSYFTVHPLVAGVIRSAEYFDKHKVKYKSIFVDEDSATGEEMVEKSGQRGVPVIDIDGKIIVGFDEPALKKALKIK